MTDYIIPFYTSEKTPERIDNLKRCISTLNKYNIIPTIVGHDPNISLNYYFIKINLLAFNKCFLLNTAIKSVVKKKFFVLDSDIIIPHYFPEFVENIVQPGTTYFPICYRLNKDKPMDYHLDEDCMDDTETEAYGGWCEGGYGLVGMCKSDWNKYSFLYNQEIGKSWGVEDDDFYYQVKSKMKVFRHKCPGLFHIWHPKTFAYKNMNHEPIIEDDFHKLRRKKYQDFMQKWVQPVDTPPN